MEHHLTVAGRTSHVVLGLEQQQRRMVEVHLHERRARQKCVEVLPGTLGLDGAPADEAAEIGRGPLAEQVRDRVLAGRRGENARVRGEHVVGHEAAVREAHDADSLSVGEALLDRPIDDGQPVAAIGIAPDPLEVLGVFLAIAH